MSEDNKLSCVWSGKRGGGLNSPSLQVTYKFFNGKKKHFNLEGVIYNTILFSKYS